MPIMPLDIVLILLAGIGVYTVFIRIKRSNYNPVLNPPLSPKDARIKPPRSLEDHPRAH